MKKIVLLIFHNESNLIENGQEHKETKRHASNGKHCYQLCLQKFHQWVSDKRIPCINGSLSRNVSVFQWHQNITV